MASGIVAKKIALFEPTGDVNRGRLENSCRLKRKHAIRRKRCQRSGPMSTQPSLSLFTSEEHLSLSSSQMYLKASPEVASSLSASCSALLDLIYNNAEKESSRGTQELKVLESPPTKPPSISFKDKRMLCRSSSLDEAVPARLNIIDIDIEIRVQRQSESPSRSPSPSHSDECIPMAPITTPSCIDKIKLVTRLEKYGSTNDYSPKSSENYGGSTGSTTSSATVSSTTSSNLNYVCSSCGTYNNSMDNLQEHIYENFALLPPPRPPKLKPLPQLSSLPLLLTSSAFSNQKNGNSVGTFGGANENCSPVTLANGAFTSFDDNSKRSLLFKDIRLHSGEEDNDNVKTLPAIISPTDCNDDEQHEKEPFYEDLYDYCLPSSECGTTELQFIEPQPTSISSFVNDKDDEVEYCDCSTVMAMAISNLTSGGTVIYNNCSSSSDTNSNNASPDNYYLDYFFSNEPLSLQTLNNNESKAEEDSTVFACEDKGIHSLEQCGNEGQGEMASLTTCSSTSARIMASMSVSRKGFFYLGVDSLKESTMFVQENGEKDNAKLASEIELLCGSDKAVVNEIKTALQPEPPHPLIIANNKTFMANKKEEQHVEEINGNNPSSELMNNDSFSNKNDDDELPKVPGPQAVSHYTSSNSSDSFYSEPIYGITNQITHAVSSTKGAAPPVPDTARRPSILTKLSSNHSPSVISCNNVIRRESSFSSTRNEFARVNNGDNASVLYADSATAHSLYSQKQYGETSFEPNNKLPPVPPSKLSTMAKFAGKKLAKKFMGIRKLSKSSLDSLDPPFSSCSSSTSGTHTSITPSVSPIGNPLTRLTPSGDVTQLTATSKTGTPTYMGKGSSQSQLRRPISRPSIPPPEPPKSLYAGSSDGSAHNFSIYDKSGVSGRNGGDDDDFDDSDFYDSDSELIRNFVSQVQPIYSMEEEPLYQYYAYGISSKPDDEYQPVIPKNLGLTLDMLVPRVGQRTLWCELQEVTTSGILSILSDKQKQLQEAIFEILTSEVSYLKSLDVLVNVFYLNKELTSVLNEEERNCLFGNVEEVKECAHAFLTELLGKWNESWYIQEIGQVINHNTNTRFTVYKEYCRNKPHQDKVLQKLRHTRDEFVNVIRTLEEDSRCQMLRMDSFLMLPMQRITRLPLLVNAVIQRTTSVKEKAQCEEALKSLTNLVLECNEAARESQDAEETLSILDKLEFLRGTPNKPLTSFGQFVMKGDFMKNPFDQGRGGSQINWTFRKSKRTFYWVLLFANQLLVTKKKSNGRFEVLDQSNPEEANIKPLPNLEGVSNDFQNYFMLHFDKKETVYFLAARTNSEIERWKSKLDSIKSSKKLRVESIFPYEARRADELSFGVGDVIDVAQMQPDGWYYGTKVDGGTSGWFPGNYCCECD